MLLKFSKSIRSSLVKIAFGAATIALAFAATYGSAPTTFAVNDVLGIASLALLANAVLLAPALYSRRPLIANALCAGTVLAGVLTMYVVHTSVYRTEVVLLVALSSVAYVTLLVAFKAIDDRPRIGAALAAVAWLSAGAVFLKATPPSTPPIGPLLEDVSFSEKPNVYLVGFDGITPAALLGRFGTDGTSFHSLMSERFRTFRNFFANHEHTLASYNMMLSLASEALYRELNLDQGVSFYSGAHDVPLFRIFRRNGYEITTISKDHYMGKRRGPYIDNYIVVSSESVCSKLGGSVSAVSFYGYCAIRPLLDHTFSTRRTEPTHCSVRFEHADVLARYFGMSERTACLQAEVIVDSLLRRSESSQPQLVLAHFFVPAHAWLGFDMEDEADMETFRRLYLTRTEYATRLLTRIADHLEVHDPGAVLFVFGDHGPWLTMSFDQTENWPFAITDRQATAAGVFPPQRCAAHLDPPAGRSADYMTTLDVLYGILSCLVGEPDARMAKSFERTERVLIRSGRRMSYGDFLYE